VVNEWFIKADPIRAEMKEEAAKVEWQPESSGKRMQDWLDNMSDWNISRKRYWGLPLPFYPCPKCGKTHVVGSLEELKRLAVDKSKVEQLSELHRPWIDEIKIKCPNCQAEVSRVTEVGDCWLDAGIVPYSTLKYNQDQSYWRKWFPADFVTEMKEQVRLWFYSMLFMSVVLESKTPYKQVLTYSPVNDEKGEEMHKSKGNAIWFDDAVEKMGADLMRWVYLSQNPAYPLRFGYNRSREIGSKFNTWWNSLYFLITYANIDNWQPEEREKKFKTDNILDRWMLSRLAEFVKTSDSYYQNYQFDKLIRGFDSFLADLSNWYIRRSRDRFWQEKMDKSKKVAYQTLYLSLMISAKVMAPALPFFSELVFRNLRTDKDKKSVHLVDYPEFDYEVDSNLIEQMKEVREIVEKALSFRAKAGIKVRQPLAKLTIEKQLAEEFIAIIKDEINVKKIEVGNKFQLDTKLTKKLKEEGISRELIRQVQSLRKEADYNFDDKIMVFYQTDSKLIRKVISDYNQEIVEEVLAKGRIEETNQTNIEPDAAGDYEIEGNKVWLAVKCL
jgi:isoleucyl-tRNA synthetase